MSIALTVFVVAETVEYFRRKPAPPTPPITPPASPTRPVQAVDWGYAAEEESTFPPTPTPETQPVAPPPRVLWAPPLPPATVMVVDTVSPGVGVHQITESARAAYPGITTPPQLGIVRLPVANLQYLYLVTATPPVEKSSPITIFCPLIPEAVKAEHIRRWQGSMAEFALGDGLQNPEILQVSVDPRWRGVANPLMALEYTAGVSLQGVSSRGLLTILDHFFSGDMIVPPVYRTMVDALGTQAVHFLVTDHWDEVAPSLQHPQQPEPEEHMPTPPEPANLPPNHEMPQLAGSPSAPRSRVLGPRGKP